MQIIRAIGRFLANIGWFLAIGWIYAFGFFLAALAGGPSGLGDGDGCLLGLASIALNLVIICAAAWLFWGLTPLNLWNLLIEFFS